MSRVNAKSGNRCPNCGGRMRLVNVTLVDKFQTPEASQYDQSVSRRKALLGKASKLSAQEMMCISCAQRAPLSSGKVAKVEKKTGKVQKVKTKKDKKARKTKKKGVVRLIKFLIFLAIVAVIAYFGYQYKDTLLGYWESIVDFFGSIWEKISNFQK